MIRQETKKPKMASFRRPPSLVCAALVLFIFLAAGHGAAAKTAAAPALAPAPGPATVDLNQILDKGGQYATFARLLKDTRVGVQVDDELAGAQADSDGITVLAPTDGAFKALKPGTLNRLTAQQQSELALYHFLPKFYTADTFETTSNPVITRASGEDGTCTVNITTTSDQQVNVTTGVDETWITGTLYAEFPLAVYSVEKVLLPEDLFGPNAGKKKAAPAADGPEAGGSQPKGSTAAEEKSGSAAGDRPALLAVVALATIIYLF